MDEEYTTIRISQKAYDKLCKIKVHPSQPIGEVVDEVVNFFVKNKKEDVQDGDKKSD